MSHLHDLLSKSYADTSVMSREAPWQSHVYYLVEIITLVTP
jgi:hypothetical protein